MKTVILIVATILSMAIVADEDIVDVTCPKCRGKKTVSSYEKCEACNGKGLIEEEIHNGSMQDTRWRDGKKPTKTSRKRCTACQKSAKRGMVKTEKECDRCGGTGKIEQVRKVPKKSK